MNCHRCAHDDLPALETAWDSKNPRAAGSRDGLSARAAFYRLKDELVNFEMLSFGFTSKWIESQVPDGTKIFNQVMTMLGSIQHELQHDPEAHYLLEPARSCMVFLSDWVARWRATRASA